uniref:Uncharacterized protein n=1 Tax=Megaselia scalaris TaxID=36166 RepID=T1GUV7_MEGSC
MRPFDVKTRRLLPRIKFISSSEGYVLVMWEELKNQTCIMDRCGLKQGKETGDYQLEISCSRHDDVLCELSGIDLIHNT